MIDTTEYTKRISRVARIGLWGSVGVVIVVALFRYASPWTFHQSDYVSRWMLIAGSVLAVLGLSMAMLVIRKQIPRMRQADSLDDKLAGYAAHVRSLFLSIFTIVTILCLMTLLSGQTVLLMLAMVATLMLFLAYPNIYKVKVDLGLTDEEMRSLYGDRYIADKKDEE